MLLGLAAVFGGACHQLKEKSKNITDGMVCGSIVALIAGVGLVIIKYATDTVVPFMYERKHLITYSAILLIVAALAYLFRNNRKSIPLVWAIVALLAGTGIVLNLFW
jgi:predicted membrane protein